MQQRQDDDLMVSGAEVSRMINRRLREHEDNARGVAAVFMEFMAAAAAMAVAADMPQERFTETADSVYRVMMDRARTMPANDTDGKGVA